MAASKLWQGVSGSDLNNQWKCKKFRVQMVKMFNVPVVKTLFLGVVQVIYVSKPPDLGCLLARLNC